MKQVFVGIGANLGDRARTISEVLARFRGHPAIAHLEVSPFYETAPVGGIEQPAFLNLVVAFETALSPEELLAQLHRWEQGLGRDRAREVRWGPRTIDLDILLFEGESRSSGGLILPHPRMWERAFVTVPLRALIDRSRRFGRIALPKLEGLRDAPADERAIRLWEPPKSN